MSWIPWAMAVGRALLGPAIILAAQRGWNGLWLGAMVLAALLSDIYDGILARRWGCDTPAVRVADSIADTIFYLGVLAALWMRDSAVLRADWPLLAALFALEILRCGFDFWKYGKIASYHSYLAKCWGLVMAVAVIAVLSFDGLSLYTRRWMVAVSVILGIFADLEGFTMSLMLPRWKNDVKTLWVAARLRREMLGPS